MATVSYQSSIGSSTTAPTQNTAPVIEYRCLFTSDVRRKQKRWQDGRLKYHTFNKRVMVYDERSNFVDDIHWREDYAFGEGEELELQGGNLVQVADCLGTKDQDLSELLDKRVKQRKERSIARIASSPARQHSQQTEKQLATPRPSLLDLSKPRPKAPNALLRNPSDQHGKASALSESSYGEGGNRHDYLNDLSRRAPKRPKIKDSQEKSGYAQNLTGATLILSGNRFSTLRHEVSRSSASEKPKLPETIYLTEDREELDTTSVSIRATKLRVTKASKELQSTAKIRNLAARQKDKECPVGAVEKADAVDDERTLRRALVSPINLYSHHPELLRKSADSKISSPVEANGSSAETLLETCFTANIISRIAASKCQTQTSRTSSDETRKDSGVRKEISEVSARQAVEGLDVSRSIQQNKQLSSGLLRIKRRPKKKMLHTMSETRELAMKTARVVESKHDRLSTSKSKEVVKTSDAKPVSRMQISMDEDVQQRVLISSSSSPIDNGNDQHLMDKVLPKEISVPDRAAPEESVSCHYTTAQDGHYIELPHKVIAGDMISLRLDGSECNVIIPICADEEDAGGNKLANSRSIPEEKVSESLHVSSGNSRGEATASKPQLLKPPRKKVRSKEVIGFVVSDVPEMMPLPPFSMATSRQGEIKPRPTSFIWPKPAVDRKALTSARTPRDNMNSSYIDTLITTRPQLVPAQHTKLASLGVEPNITARNGAINKGKSQPDIGPWSTEAFDLFDWRPK
jgi:hypothetical protein